MPCLTICLAADSIAGIDCNAINAIEEMQDNRGCYSGNIFIAEQKSFTGLFIAKFDMNNIGIIRST